MNSPSNTNPSKSSRPRLPLAGWALPLLLAYSSHAQSLVTEYPAYFVDETFNVSFNQGPGNAKDWIGVYPEGTVPGSTGATRWDYLDDTRNGALGVKEGQVNLPGLAAAGIWTAHFLLNDGYTILSQTNFTVLDLGTPLVRAQRSAAPKATFEVHFFNAPGNIKDWVGIFKEGQVPGAPNTPSTLWAYVDGTQNGTTANTEGTLTFTGGLATAGNYVAYLLENDGYTILSSQPFSIVESATQAPRILSVSPAPQATGIAPSIEFAARITNGVTRVDLSSIEVLLNGSKVTHTAIERENGVDVSYQSTQLPAPGSNHRFQIQFKDTANPPNTIVGETTFTIADYRDIRLPAPIAGTFENFDTTPEGQLPTGWTTQSFTDVQNPELDLGNLDSASYANWVAVDVSRFTGSFVTYSNPENPQGWEDDYRRVLTENPLNVLNGTILKGPLASGRMLFGNSGYRNGAGQILYVFTPDYDLTGKTDIHVAFKSLWEQNQDSIAALEYSVDKGATWMPVFYFLHAPDIVLVTDELTGVTTIDAEATFNTERADIARWIDVDTGNTLGGTYGSFIAAPISQELGPYFQPRIDDNSAESKRVESYRLTKADNQKTVRFRFAHAGTDSWYWGIDDFGLYSITTIPSTPPTLAWTRTAAGLTLSWPGDATGYVLEGSASLDTPVWSAVSGVNGTQAEIPVTESLRFFRLRKP